VKEMKKRKKLVQILSAMSTVRRVAAIAATVATDAVSDARGVIEMPLQRRYSPPTITTRNAKEKK